LSAEAKQAERGASLLLAEATCVAGMTAFLSGPIRTAFLADLGAGEVRIGLVDGVMSLGGISLLFAHHFIERWQSRKRVCLGSFGIGRSLRGLFMFLPFLLLAFSTDVVIWCFILLTGLMNLVVSIGTISRLSWISDLVPEERRSRFFAARNRITMGAGALLAVGAAAFVDWWKRACRSLPLAGYQFVFAASALCGLGSLLCFALAPEPRLKADKHRESILASLRRPFRHRDYRALMLFIGAWGLATGLTRAFIPYFMYKKLGLPVGLVALFTLVGQSAMFYAAGFWGKLADRFGCKPVIMMGGVVVGVYPMLWVFVNRETYLLIPILFLLWSFDPAVTLSMMSMRMKLAPQRGRALYLSTASFVMRMSSAVGPVAGGFIAWMLADVSVPVGFNTLGNLHFLFLIGGAARLASLLLLMRVHEPRAQTARYVIRVVRQIEGFNPSRRFMGFVAFWIEPLISVSKGVVNTTRVIKDAVKETMSGTQDEEESREPRRRDGTGESGG